MTRLLLAFLTWFSAFSAPDMTSYCIVLGEKHLRRILCGYFESYPESRTHLSLGKDPPCTRAVQPPEVGAIVEIAEVGGLHHRYERRAA